jgi:DNA transformation protein and related proteins
MVIRGGDAQCQSKLRHDSPVFATWEQDMGGSAIREFPGLGPKSEAMLALAGIGTFEQLKTLGAARAFAMVRMTQARPSLNLLWGMESAISGVPWQTIARQNRLSLLMELEEVEKDMARNS